MQEFQEWLKKENSLIISNNKNNNTDAIKADTSSTNLEIKSVFKDSDNKKKIKNFILEIANYVSFVRSATNHRELLIDNVLQALEKDPDERLNSVINDTKISGHTKSILRCIVKQALCKTDAKDSQSTPLKINNDKVYNILDPKKIQLFYTFDINDVKNPTNVFYINQSKTIIMIEPKDYQIYVNDEKIIKDHKVLKFMEEYLENNKNLMTLVVKPSDTETNINSDDLSEKRNVKSADNTFINQLNQQENLIRHLLKVNNELQEENTKLQQEVIELKKSSELKSKQYENINTLQQVSMNRMKHHYEAREEKLSKIIKTLENNNSQFKTSQETNIVHDNSNISSPSNIKSNLENTQIQQQEPNKLKRRSDQEKLTDKSNTATYSLNFFPDINSNKESVIKTEEFWSEENLNNINEPEEESRQPSKKKFKSTF